MQRRELNRSIDRADWENSLHVSKLAGPTWIWSRDSGVLFLMSNGRNKESWKVSNTTSLLYLTSRRLFCCRSKLFSFIFRFHLRSSKISYPCWKEKLEVRRFIEWNRSRRRYVSAMICSSNESSICCTRERGSYFRGSSRIFRANFICVVLFRSELNCRPLSFVRILAAFTSSLIRCPVLWTISLVRWPERYGPWIGRITTMLLSNLCTR